MFVSTFWNTKLAVKMLNHKKLKKRLTAKYFIMLCQISFSKIFVQYISISNLTRFAFTTLCSRQQLRFASALKTLLLSESMSKIILQLVMIIIWACQREVLGNYTEYLLHVCYCITLIRLYYYSYLYFYADYIVIL